MNQLELIPNGTPTEEVMCNGTDATNATSSVAVDIAAEAVPKRSKKAPVPPPTPAGPRSKATRIVTLAQTLALTDAEAGELNVLMDREMNTGSPKLLDWLYGAADKGGCGFPPRFKKSGGKNTDSLARSTDALLATYRMDRDERLKLCLHLIGLKKQVTTLALKTDSDGRVRYSINIAGTRVGRMSCSASSTGSGTNMTTVSERHRHLFPADAGCDFYSIDLKGADGWTIGAECAALGDTRMLDDLRAGLKPANSVTLLWLHGQQVNQWPMDKCLDEQAKLDESDWRYKASKAGIWGTAYGEGDVTLSANILEEAWKSSGELMYVSAADCKKLQAAVFARYPGIKRRMERINMLLARDGSLTNCAGCKRDFFAPKNAASTQREGYAYTPAFNTAYANNQALLKIWRDQENMGVDGQRRFRVRLTVHDSILGCAPIEDRNWVASRIGRWFDNPLEIAGMTLTIPFKAKRGPSWGELVSL